MKLWHKILMKASSMVFLMVAVGSLPGCASTPHGLVLDPVGPPLARPVAASPQGTLVVFSAYTAHGPGPNEPDYRQHHSSYQIFSASGQLLQTVPNDDAAPMGEDPTEVKLPAGTYRVVARANGYGVVTVPVVIADDQVTTVHLEGGASWPDQTAFTPGNTVRLPDGQVAGWRAGAGSTAKAFGP
jgi:hypothetical protein